uniref:IS21 family transposase n=1 Tax=Enterocloster clostridioformis TaxID=1531 RepID=UPI00307A538A
MTDWYMYNEIQKLKSMGFSKSRTADKLQINFRTVKRYWDMTPADYSDAFKDLHRNMRNSTASRYEQEILAWLEQHPDLSSAQIYDWLYEKYQTPPVVAERTMRRYIAWLREQHAIPRQSGLRSYEAVQELPPAEQAQVDMGSITLTRQDGARIKVFCFAMVLSHSRYKYAFWQDHPFTTAEFITAHQNAFAFFGGRPKQMVYDQDRVLAVSENHGDIIYTEGFQTYALALHFEIYLCRGADPESKGKIEAVVKYLKYNFAKNRAITDISQFNSQCMDWLSRTGNGKEHQTTKKVPAQMFALEKQHLIPVPAFETTVPESIVTYQVRKDNTVLYHSNRYQVPFGTYRPGLRARLVEQDGKVSILDAQTGEVYTSHSIPAGKGNLVRITNPERRRGLRAGQMQEKALEKLGCREDAADFLNRIREEKPRYATDQMRAILTILETWEGSGAIETALDYCIRQGLYSAADFGMAVEYFAQTGKPEPETTRQSRSIPEKYQTLHPAVRSIQEYIQASEG